MGLDAGATPEDIRTAFRRLARELHPDVTGQKSDFRFKQVTGAYNAVKGLTAEELDALTADNPAYELIREHRQREAEARRLAEEVDGILDKYERSLKDYYAASPDTGNIDIKSAIFRMKSRNPRVIHAVLKHCAHLANRTEFRTALAGFLSRPEIDEQCAEVIASLPFDDSTRKLLALDSASNAENLPAGLILSLIGRDPDVIESFLLHIRPEDYAAVLRRWPAGRAMNSSVVRKLLDSDDARVLVPLLSLIKSSFPQSAAPNRKRLSELEGHSSAAVRAWAKKLV
ncbi:MAG: DnaJ domain-containing protein [Synergistaceae bacterium]|nr:DnaJ domain-containing protein [Synergistaceae bacterium]MBQ3655129.1 DnaJ domain-containing protein [Synergistaceae bacterium]